jgi:allantoin racemase
VRILVVNPNTTATMTETMRAGAQRYARAGTEIVAVEPTWGPESIEGFLEGFLSAAAVLERLATYPDPVDAVLLAGYGEPGLQGAMELMDVPVLDVTSASAHVACLVAHRFGVVTTLDRCIPQIEEALGSVGLLGRCSGIRASGLAVLEIEQDEERTMAAMIAEVTSSTGTSISSIAPCRPGSPYPASRTASTGSG